MQQISPQSRYSWKRQMEGMCSRLQKKIIFIFIIVCLAIVTSACQSESVTKNSTETKQTIKTTQASNTKSTTTVDISKLNSARKATGIYQNVKGLLDSTIENEWCGMIDGKYLVIYAGVRKQNVNQGDLIIQHEIQSEGEIPYDGYTTPTKNGSVHILSEKDGKLTLQAKDGTMFLFDIASRKFVQVDASSEKNNPLADKLNQISKDYTKLMTENAALKARLYLIPDLYKVYDITPAPQIENGWYVVDQISTIHLKGYENAKQVKFMATIPSRSLSPIMLGNDRDGSNGWNYHGALLGEDNTIVWAEVTQANGQMIQAPIIAILSKLSESAIVEKPDTKFKDISEPKAVVSKYYELVSTGNYKDAWELIHIDERTTYNSLAFRQSFLALQGTNGPKLDAIITSNVLSSFKIYILEATISNVIEMKIKLSNGTEKTIHLVKDKEKNWRLFWEPDRGLE